MNTLYLPKDQGPYSVLPGEGYCTTRGGGDQNKLIWSTSRMIICRGRSKNLEENLLSIFYLNYNAYFNNNLQNGGVITEQLNKRLRMTDPVFISRTGRYFSAHNDPRLAVESIRCERDHIKKWRRGGARLEPAQNRKRSHRFF
jgi:hypothetical protein